MLIGKLTTYIPIVIFSDTLIRQECYQVWLTDSSWNTGDCQFPEWSRSRPQSLQVRNQVLRISSDSCIKFGNGNVGDFQLLPRLFFVCHEYFVERLINSSN